MSQGPKEKPVTVPETGVRAGTDAAGNGRKRRRALLIALLVGVLAGSGGFVYRLHTLRFETTDDAFVEGHVVFISSQVAGQVVKVAVEDNQRVNAGDLLVESGGNRTRSSSCIC
jgi:membrane fusion protein (multidrug efflux system)